MFVRKSQITSLIKKEKQRERVRCERESQQEIQKVKERIERDNKLIIREMLNSHKDILQEKEKEILTLKREIQKNYNLYNDVRRREVYLDQLTSEIEDVVEHMVVKVQESLQPFYRTRSKIEGIKRKSDKRHEKVESIFSAVK